VSDNSTTAAPLVFWQTIEFTKRGAESRYVGSDFAFAENLYESLDNAYFVELHGRGADGRPIPGVMCENIPLRRKAHGVEQSLTGP
jgi:hypothetical protein